MKKKILLVTFAVCITCLNADDLSDSRYGDSFSSSSDSYESRSGNTYQYDMNKHEDRIRHQYDYNAQQRDRSYHDYAGDIARDRENGQHGGGIYDD